MIHISRLPHQNNTSKAKQSPKVTPFVRDTESQGNTQDNSQFFSTNRTDQLSGGGHSDNNGEMNYNNGNAQGFVAKQEKKTGISWLTPTNIKNKKGNGLAITSARSPIESSKTSQPQKSMDSVDYLHSRINQLTHQIAIYQSRIDNLSHQCSLLQHQNQTLNLAFQDSCQKQAETKEIAEQLKIQLESVQLQLKNQKDKKKIDKIKRRLILQSDTINVQNCQEEAGQYGNLLNEESVQLTLEEKYNQIVQLFNMDTLSDHSHLIDKIQSTIKMFGQYALQTDSELYSLSLKVSQAESQSIHFQNINLSLQQQLNQTNRLLQLCNQQLTLGHILKLDSKYSQLQEEV